MFEIEFCLILISPQANPTNVRPIGTHPGAVRLLKCDMFSVSGQLELNGELVELDSESDRISFNGSRSAVLQIFAV